MTALNESAGASPMTADSAMTPTSVAILIGGDNAAATSKTVSVVVWICHERARQSPQDPWHYTLEYFEFLDDTMQWTHLDQLLLRYPPQSLHVAYSDIPPSSKTPLNAAAKAKQQRREQLMQNLQVFLDERHQAQEEDENLSPSCHLHTQVPFEATKIESAVSLLLLQDDDAQLAFRGNLELSQGKLLQQGLALWLQSQELYPPSTTLSDPQWQHSLKIEPGTLRSHLVMDRTAASCIHLLPPANAGEATIVGGQAHNNSLLGLLSQQCQTSMGKAKLQVWLRQPLIQLEGILYRQNAVTTLVQGLGKDSLKEALQAFTGVDLPGLAASLSHFAPTEDGAIMNTKKPLKALYRLYLLSSIQLPQLLDAMDSFDYGASQLLVDALEQLQRLHNELGRCQDLVENVLDLDSAPREYLVKPSFNDELQGLYQEIAHVHTQVDDELKAMQDEWAQASGDDNSQIRLETFTENSSESSSATSWQFRLTDTNFLKVLDDMDGIKTHRVLKNGVYFSNKNLRGLSAQYQQLSLEYSQHSQGLVQQAMEVALTYESVVERAAQVVSTLDVVTALARVAAYSPHGYCKPTLTDSDEDGAGIEVRGNC